MPEPETTIHVSCPDELTLSQFVNDLLAPEDDARVARHVDSCPACQRLLERGPETLPHDLAFVLATLPGSEDAPPHLDGYEVLGQLGVGGMGVVWRVRELEFDREVAVKVMKTGLCGEPDLEARFLTEAQICARLEHPSIVTVHKHGRLEDHRPYYVMKLVAGKTLASLLEGRSTPAERLLDWMQIFAEVCRAVGYAHRCGVIHRDLKPANLMVGQHREVQVMDWGLAKVLVGPSELMPEKSDARSHSDTWHDIGGLTRNDSVLGTSAYMSPEQARGVAEEVDQRSDVFGLGAILCEILTGVPPYLAGTGEALLRQAKEADLANAMARIQGSGADAELIRLATRCLARRKEDRPADAAEVAASVEAYLSAVQERRQQERLERERQQVKAVEKRRRLGLWAALAVTLVASALLGVFALVSPDLFTPSPANRIRIGVWPYPAYAPLVAAAEMKLCDGLNVEIEDVGDIKVARKKMDSGDIQGSVCVVDSHVHTRAQGTRAKVVLKLAPSHGADGIVVKKEKSINSLADLHGKKVALVESEPPHFLLLALAAATTEKVDLGKVDWQLTTAEGAAKLFIANEVDAAITYEPYLSDAAKNGGGRVLVSSEKVPNTIVDILTVEERYLTTYPESVRKVIRGWFKAVEILQPGHPRREEAIGHACRVLKLSREEYDKMAPLSPYAGVQENLDFFTPGADGPSPFRKLMAASQDRWNLLRDPTIKLGVNVEDADGSDILLKMKDTLLEK